MPSQTPSPPLTVTVVAALWVSLGRCGASEPPGPGCDNGKLRLDRDLPADDSVYLGCSVTPWPESAEVRPSIDTVYEPEPAMQVCMDEPIFYNQTIPNSGGYRPVRAESGEYLYCPPQRWLNNLHPIALISWGRTLELSTVASPDTCEALAITSATRNKFNGVNHVRKYNLLLTRPAKQHRQQHTQPEEHSTNNKEFLRQCCERAISSLLNNPTEAELETEVKKEGKGRKSRAAVREKQQIVKNESKRDNTTLLTGQINRKTIDATGVNKVLRPSADSPPGNRTLLDPPAPRESISQSKIQNQGVTLRSTPPLAYRQTATPLLSPKLTDHKNTNPSAVDSERDHTETRRAPLLSSKDEDTESRRHRGEEKAYHKAITGEGKMKDNEVVDVKERELEQRQTHGATHSHHKSENNGFDSVSKSQLESEPEPQPARYLPTSHDCDSCKASGAANQVLPRTPRTDEAVWAAAALGFLLVLLTLSVLHTRLYRHWRTTPSLYWHDPRQDYDSVADVIRRRLKIAKRRRKRGRRQECVLLPSSSSSDED
ncbi:uncharacterized protein tp53i13 isoform X2 [Echeneis naucrates]|uniref:uncharacterized protein tp53i13 isoform X2 n=1 Tax=Echeneis naucrates TaxID=173247 RepID=UPI0011144F9C|nr:tumor protein p53-inducible protein 13 isoform X2 [Echeneis naucrates]